MNPGDLMRRIPLGWCPRPDTCPIHRPDHDDQDSPGEPDNGRNDDDPRIGSADTR